MHQGWLYLIIAIEAAAIALLFALVRSFGRIAGARIDPVIVPQDTSLSSRILRWLMAPQTQGIPPTATYPVAVTLTGDSSPRPSLNSHVGSQRPVMARASRSVSDPTTAPIPTASP